MWCWRVLQLLLRGGRRQVLLLIFVLLGFSLHVLVHQRALQPFTLLRLRADMGGRLPVGEIMANTSSPITTLPRPCTALGGFKASSSSPQDTPVKKVKHQEDPFKKMVVLSSWPPKVKFPLMVFCNLGRLGNRLNSYATALTFHAAHYASSTIAVTRDTMDQLFSLLDPTNLTLPVVDKKLLNEAKKRKVMSGSGPNWAKNDQVSHLEPAIKKAEKEYRESGTAKVVCLGGYPNRMWMLAGHHHTIRAAFRFRDDLKQKVARFKEEVKRKKGRREITFVGFHIRRTDYTKFIKNFFKCTLPGPAFYHSAMNHYRATLDKPVFVVASDNISYARQHLNASDVVFSDMQAAAEDMALLGSCSHSIMTVGSFGFWASFFAGGQVVYPLLNNCTLKPFVHPDHLGQKGYENWKPFDINGGGPV